MEEQIITNEEQPEKNSKRNKIIEMLKSLRNGINTKKLDKMIDESEVDLADEVNKIMEEEGKGRSSR